MSVRYIGTNLEFAASVQEVCTPIVKATETGRFRSLDAFNRQRFPLTAALLDAVCFPYSKKCRERHHRRILLALQRGVVLDFIDMEI